MLYAHGGLYADLDMECVRPLDNITRRHACMLTEENHAHTYVVHHRPPPTNVINCLMAGRPRHPYFRDVILELPVQKRRGKDGEVLTQTGPFLIDAVLRRWEQAALSFVKCSLRVKLPLLHCTALTFSPVSELWNITLICRPDFAICPSRSGTMIETCTFYYELSI